MSLYYSDLVLIPCFIRVSRAWCPLRKTAFSSPFSCQSDEWWCLWIVPLVMICFNSRGWLSLRAQLGPEVEKWRCSQRFCGCDGCGGECSGKFGISHKKWCWVLPVKNHRSWLWVEICMARGLQLSHRTLFFPVGPVSRCGFVRVHLCLVHTDFSVSCLPCSSSALTSTAWEFKNLRFESISQEICTFAFTLRGLLKKTRIPRGGAFVKMMHGIFFSAWWGFGCAFDVGTGQNPGKHHTASKIWASWFSFLVGRGIEGGKIPSLPSCVVQDRAVTAATR